MVLFVRKTNHSGSRTNVMQCSGSRCVTGVTELLLLWDGTGSIGKSNDWLEGSEQKIQGPGMNLHDGG